jgi:lysozyme family protein
LGGFFVGITMTASSFSITSLFTISQEGGYTNDPNDSGNWSSGICGVGNLIGSNMGCGAPSTIAYMGETEPNVEVTAEWMQALPVAVYSGMALTLYWDPLQCNAMPPGLDLSMFDSGWNIGTVESAVQLQKVLGATQDGDIGPITLGLISTVDVAYIAQSLGATDAAMLQRRLVVTPDGIVGPKTLAALAAQPNQRVPVLLIALYEKQVSYYRSLFNFDDYGAGWLARASARLTAALALNDQKSGA